jgi:hypothetical protein
MNDGDLVATWPDSSGNAHDATQTTVASQPVFKKNAINGLPALTFDAVDDVMIVPWDNTNITPWTAFVVGRINADAPAAYFMTCGDPNAKVGITISAKNGGSGLLNWATYTAFAGWLDSGEALVIGEANILEAYTGTYQSMIGSIYRNGAFRAAVTGYDNLMGLIYGGTGQIGGAINGDIAEILLYSSVLSDADRRTIEAYLSTKYDIALVADHYDKVNSSQLVGMGAAQWTGFAQSFTSKGGGVLYSAKFNLGLAGGLLTGNIYAKLYASTGVVGSTAIPTGAPLAVSNPLDAATIQATKFYEFLFTGANCITLVDGTDYHIAIEYYDPPNPLATWYDAGAGTHYGNMSGHMGTGGAYAVWSAGYDFPFYVCVKWPKGTFREIIADRLEAIEKAQPQ